MPLKENKKMNQIIELIKIAEEKSSPDIWYTINSESFIELERHSNELLNIAIELIEGNDLSFNEKAMVVCVIRNVKFEKKKQFLHELAESYCNNEKVNTLSDEDYDFLVTSCFFPLEWDYMEPDYWDYTILENYEDPLIQEAFRIVLKSDRIAPAFRAFCEKILDGSMLEMLSEVSTK
jgi:hypothetical protein